MEKLIILTILIITTLASYKLTYPKVDNPLNIKVDETLSNNYIIVLANWAVQESDQSSRKMQQAVADKMNAFVSKHSDKNLLMVLSAGNNFINWQNNCSVFESRWRDIYSSNLTNVPWLSLYGKQDWTSQCPFNQSRFASASLQSQFNLKKINTANCPWSTIENIYLPDFSYSYSLSELLNVKILILDESYRDLCHDNFNGALYTKHDAFSQCTRNICYELRDISAETEKLIIDESIEDESSQFLLVTNSASQAMRVLNEVRFFDSNSAKKKWILFGDHEEQACYKKAHNGECQQVSVGGGGNIQDDINGNGLHGFFVIGFDDEGKMTQPYGVAAQEISVFKNDVFGDQFSHEEEVKISAKKKQSQAEMLMQDTLKLSKEGKQQDAQDLSVLSKYVFEGCTPDIVLYILGIVLFVEGIVCTIARCFSAEKRHSYLKVVASALHYYAWDLLVIALCVQWAYYYVELEMKGFKFDYMPSHLNFIVAMVLSQLAFRVCVSMWLNNVHYEEISSSDSSYSSLLPVHVMLDTLMFKETIRETFLYQKNVDCHQQQKNAKLPSTMHKNLQIFQSSIVVTSVALICGVYSVFLVNESLVHSADWVLICMPVLAFFGAVLGVISHWWDMDLFSINSIFNGAYCTVLGYITYVSAMARICEVVFRVLLVVAFAVINVYLGASVAILSIAFWCYLDREIMYLSTHNAKLFNFVSFSVFQLLSLRWTPFKSVMLNRINENCAWLFVLSVCYVYSSSVFGCKVCEAQLAANNALVYAIVGILVSCCVLQVVLARLLVYLFDSQQIKVSKNVTVMPTLQQKELDVINPKVVNFDEEDDDDEAQLVKK